uniref:t-SNARE coiled-coil homology domain-containing protein n=1 Tax=Syphacia muris TaxID=451379 RepID=A0A0N5APW4_9BILA
MTGTGAQGPLGITRNLTEVFVLLRNNAQQNKFIYGDNFPVVADEKMSLVGLDEESGNVVAETSSKTLSEWVTYLDETQYEFTRIRMRLNAIREAQQKSIANPSFSDDLEDQEKIDAATEEVTRMLNHCHRFIGMIENAHVRQNSQEAILKDNVVSTLRLKLSNVTAEFRTNQATYLKQIEARKETVDSYLLSSSSGWVTVEALDTAPNGDEGLTMEQIQLLLQNADMVKERERDVLAVSKSILQLNSLFKDLAAMIVDQGTVLDRIDYNVEQTSLKVKTALKSVEKAERYQRSDKKMHCIAILSITIIVLLILLIIVKT